jgi:Restriction endonuclease XhoI
VRDAQSARQAASGTVDAGTRGSVTGGGHLDALADVLEKGLIDNGVARSAIKRSNGVEVPGYYRPTKKWDLVVAARGFLIAAIELKSQVGPSFGNNFNNRTEEAIGSAVDLRRAYEAGSLGTVAPWLGYVFILEDSPRSTTPVKVARSAIPAEEVFTDLSYLGRYQVLLRRLVADGLYDAACFATLSREPGAEVVEPDPALSFAAFQTAISTRVADLRESGLLG